MKYRDSLGLRKLKPNELINDVSYRGKYSKNVI
jgi:hypothetical protein